MNALDRRLHAFRPDLADIRLQGRVEAARFVAGEPARIVVPVADVKSAPDAAAGMDTQFLLGDDVEVFERREGWAWVQGRRDNYVGYVAETVLGPVAADLTHQVSVPRTVCYAEPDMKRPVTRHLSIGSRLAITGQTETRGLAYGRTETGDWIVMGHVTPLAGQPVTADYVSIAEILLHTPYLWGGTSAFGIDCSGLVQLSLRMAGRDVVRDTDMQAAGLGHAIAHTELRRGDLVFWKGHVAIMTDAATLIHANGHTMTVAMEPLDGAITRIGYLYGQPTAFRRVQ
ncbi:MAG: peptidase P60 [Phyllobacteriaceae bacterium]|nr:peptidase P60 [Phyllobacteriaceae bacterium]MBA92634.1 peptidase P60 [Phyllobacteriaceae bacterium]